MSTYAYQEILNRIQGLTAAEQLKLLEDLATMIRQQVTIEPLHSPLEFEGVGEGVWWGQGIDAQEFVNQERASWDG